MTEWYRRKTWNKTDEEEFFAKLRRARKSGQAQYLKIQAIELIETKGKLQLDAAEILLNKVLTGYPDDKIERSQTLNSLGEIYVLRENYDKALDYFRQALNFEKVFPNIKTTAYLNFSETVVRTEKTELYGEAENILTEEIKKDTLKFPAQNYIMYSVLSIISEFKGDLEDAKKFAELAKKNATTGTNTLWNPRKRNIGIVKERKTWLDKLVNRK
jgi:tetratricopeptide (TPR) repeat protein